MSSLLNLLHLVEADDRSRHPLALREGLGDAWVLANIPVLARQRVKLRECGYTYVPEESQTPEQRLLPTLQLLSMLRGRKIPFRSTRAAVDSLLGTGTSTIDVSAFCSMCAPNYTFHEGAHAHFFAVVETAEGMTSGKRLVEVLLASEAYALALNMTTMLIGLVDDEPSTRAFLALNVSADPISLTRFEREAPGVTRRLRELCLRQFSQVMHMLTSACLISMLRPSVAGKPGLSPRLREEAGLPESTAGEAECLTQMAFSVDREFRDQITDTFFSHIGLVADYRKIRAEPLETSLGPEGVLRSYLPRVLES